MSCESLITDTDDPQFPFDDQAPVYLRDNIVSLENVILSIGVHLDIGNEFASEFFFKAASKAQIDLIGDGMDGLYRPATREGAKALFECCYEWGSELDWNYSQTDLKDQWLFDKDQIDKMVNDEVKGKRQPFSVTDFLATAESLKANAERPLESTERNTLLIVIAALIKHAGISLERSSKAAGIVAGLTQELGAKVSISTIEKIIKQIPDAVDRRST